MNDGRLHPAKAGNAFPRSIQRQAAEWLALRQARQLTLAEEADFADWIARDHRHRALYEEVEASWRAFDRLTEYPHSSDLAPNPDLLARPPRAFRFRAPSMLAAAAAIALMAVAVWRFNPQETTRPHVATAAVAHVEPRLVRLPDGSEVEMNAGGEISEHFSATERRVRLVRGEAHFLVAKNTERPFIVEANGVAVRAVGTAFNVRFSPDATAVEILVTEGTVKVARPVSSTPTSGPRTGIRMPESATDTSVEDAAILTAGQRTVVSTIEHAESVQLTVETLPALEIDRALSWQTRRLILDSTPLASVAERFNRHAAGREGFPRLTVTDPRLRAMKISGSIRSENIESFVEALETNFDVIAERRPDGEIVLRRRR